MFRAAVLALSIASASAFVAPSASRAATALEAKKQAPAPEKKTGGGYYSGYSPFPPFYEAVSGYGQDFGAPASGVWDPLGLLYDADQVRILLLGQLCGYDFMRIIDHLLQSPFLCACTWSL